ncbi:MAG TPA: SH3 domain-containing protein [Thermoanaerobaculia bacterium]|nr:SH3 domain-containing protein [Thermoanaerobaculia bacterium]
MRRTLLLLVMAWLSACQSAEPAPQPETLPPVMSQPVLEEAETVTGTVRVTASSLNVRVDPTTSSEKIASLRRGERVGLIREEDGWSRVRLASGHSGWVSSQYVRPDSRCEADRDFTFVVPPVPSFSDSGAHGIVVVEATVDVKGEVTSVKTVSNTTGATELAALTEREIRQTRFSPPVRNCRRIPFIYVYKRTF